MLYSLFTLQILIRNLELFEVWWNNLIGLCLHDEVIQSHQCFAYPQCYLVLSCVMLSMSFVQFLGWSDVLGLWSILLFTRKTPSLQKLTSKPKIVTTSKPCFNTTTCSSCLALVSALGKLNDLPVVTSSSIQQHQTCLHKCVSSQGLMQPSLLKNPVTIIALKDHFSALDNVQLEGSFHFIVDTGCTTSVSCHEDYFEQLELLSSPITLHGVAGDSKVTSGGVIKFDCIDTNGHVVTI